MNMVVLNTSVKSFRSTCGFTAESVIAVSEVVLFLSTLERCLVRLEHTDKSAAECLGDDPHLLDVFGVDAGDRLRIRSDFPARGTWYG